MDRSYRQLAFLLSLGGIPLACSGDDSSTASNTDATTTTDPTVGSMTSSTTDPTTTAATGMTGTASESGTTEASATDTATTGETATSSETTSTTGDGTVCENFATYYAECDEGSYDGGLATCEEQLLLAAAFGAACETAVTNYYACVPSLTCEEYAETGCAEQQDAADTACVPEVGATCAAYGAKVAGCFDDTDDEDIYCQEAIIAYGVYYGEDCGQAYEDYFVCLTALDCADLDDDTGCEKAEAMIEDLCG